MTNLDANTTIDWAIKRPNSPLPPALLINIIFVLCLILAGCSAKQADTITLKADEDDGSSGSEAVLAKDQAIPAPNLPPKLAAEVASDKTSPKKESKAAAIPYFVDCSSPGAPELAASFAKISLLQRLADQPPDSMTGLEQRLYVSLEEGRDILKSYGFYSGKITGRIGALSPETEAAIADAQAQNGYAPDGADSSAGAPGQSGAAARSGAAAESSPSDASASGSEGETAGKSHAGKVPVHIYFDPGPQYLLGRTSVATVSPPRQPEDKKKLPETLDDVGMARGSPAVADSVLAAVDRVRDSFQNQGYPFAAIDGTRYVLDHEKHELEADVRINEGEYVRMGDVNVEGKASVTQRYLEALRTWEPGAPWNRDKVDAYQDALRQTGLFRSIALKPADKTDDNGRRDIMTTLAPAPERTVSAELKYDSDFGIGVQAGWEHRNLTGNGDNLRVSLPIWQNMQEFTAKYRLPYFIRNDQAFLAQGGLLHEKTDAYEINSAAGSTGLEKRFSPQWTGSARVSAEGGNIKDPGEKRRDYSLFGIPLGLAYDNTGNPLDAVRGFKGIATVTPYTGKYGKDFSALRSRFDAYAFVPVVGNDTLVMAMRGTYGAFWGGNGVTAPDVPPSVRFYSGGGGSVRGYSYQSLGPRNSSDDPLGGSSLLEMSAEARWKITQEWGVVAFMDGGMAYDDDRLVGQDLRWGTGLGLRYYTAIGPVRVDVATPVNPRKDDPSVQFYMSIGQSF